MTFTNDAIKAMKPGETLHDKGSTASVQGLHIRCLATGQKSFMFYYRSKAGQQRRPKIGDYPDITIPEARKRTKSLADQVAVGKDPKGEWNQARREKTVGDLFMFTLEKLWNTERFIRSNRYHEVQGLWKNHLQKPFETLKISELTPMLVKAWHSNLKDIPYTANRTLEVLSRIISFSQEHGLFPSGPNPCEFVTPNSEKKRKRFASDDETAKIVAILNRDYSKYPLGVTFLFAMMLTGSRPIALERATWDQLQEILWNGERYGILTFKGKTSEETGEDETVIFPPLLMEKISILPRIKGGTIFSSKMPKRLWGKIQVEVGCKDLRARDFRRWFASQGLSSGVNLSTIGDLLNHHSTQTTKVYAKLAIDSRVAAASAIASKVETLLQMEGK